MKVSCLRSARPWFFPFLLLCVLQSYAGEPVMQQFEIGIDRDNNLESGCSLTLQNGETVAGIDLTLQIHVENDSGSTSVVLLEAYRCDGQPADLDRLVWTSNANWPVGSGQGVNGTDVVEALIPLGLFGTTSQFRFVVQSQTASGGWDVIDTQINTPIEFMLPFQTPTLGTWGLLCFAVILLIAAVVIMRRSRSRKTAAAVLVVLLFSAFMNTFIMDGNIDDWNGIDPAATDAMNDTSNGDQAGDIQAFFVSNDSDHLFFRLDITELENAPPIAVDDSAQTLEDIAVDIDILANDSDPDVGDTLTLDSVTQPTNGTVTVNVDQTVNYAPDLGFSGTDTFDYTISDTLGITATATVTVTVKLVNAPPVANDDAYTLAEGATLNQDATGGLLANDSDPDNDPLTVSAITQPINGSLTLNQDGSFTYTHDGGKTTDDSFTYVANDGLEDSPVATVNLTISAVNDDPTADAASVSTDEDTPLAITLTGSDPENDPLTFAIAAQPSNGTLSGTAPNLTYTPDADFNGSDSFTFTVDDGTATSAPATITISVNSVNDAPTVSAIADQNIVENQTTGPIGFTIGDDDTAASALIVTATSSDQMLLPDGNITLAGSDANRTIDLAPAADSTGSATITVTVDDGSDTAMVSFLLNVTVDNVAPVITEGDTQGVTMSEDGNPTAFSLTLNATDADMGDTLTWSIATPASNGVATANGMGTSQVVDYVPNADFNGSDSFVVRVTDAQGATDTITITVTVEAVNDEPIITEGDNVGVTMSEDGAPTAFSLTLNATDVDTGTTLTWSVIGAASNGMANASGMGNSQVVTYTPNDDFNGSDSFIVQVSDGAGGMDQITVNVTIEAVNDDPEITEGDNTGVTMSEDSDPTAFSLTLNATDVDTGDTLNWSLASAASNGMATASGSGASLAVDYTPDPDFNGSDSFSVQVSDGNGGSDTITVNVTVQPTNDAPVITEGDNVGVTMSEDGNPTPFMLTLNATDGDSTTLTWSLLTPATNGMASANGMGNSQAINYVPNGDFNGSDSFIVQVDDGDGGTDQITVNVTVQAVNDLPEITEGASIGVTMSEDGAPTAFSLALNATDVDSATLTWSLASAASNGMANASGMGMMPTVTYVPNGDFNGSDSFVVQVDDGDGGMDQITVNVTVDPVNDAPTFTSSGITSALEDVVYTYNITTADVDTGDTFTITAPTLPAWLGLTDNADGTAVITGTPTAMDAGDNDVTLRVNDGTVDVDQSFTIVVSLMAADLTYTTAGNTELVAGGFARQGVAAVVETDGVLTTTPALMVTSLGPFASDQGGSVTMMADGSFSYIPPVGLTGAAADTFDYTTDNGDSGTVTINIEEQVWYVDDADGGLADGTSANPFTTLADAETAAGMGDYIFIQEGDTQTTPLDGSLTLQDDQTLAGEGVDFELTLNGMSRTLVSAGTAAHITNSTGDAVTIADVTGVTVRGLEISSTSDNAIDVSTTGIDDFTVTLTDLNVSGATNEGILVFSNSTGLLTMTLSNSTVTASGNGVTMVNNNGDLNLDMNTNTDIIAADGIVLNGSLGAGTFTITDFSDNTIHGDTTGTAISLTGVIFDTTPGAGFDALSAGTTVIGDMANPVDGTGLSLSQVSGDLDFADLTVYVENGTALSAVGTGELDAGAGTGFGLGLTTGLLDADTGSGLQLDNLTAAMTVADLQSSAAMRGINITNTTGTVTLQAGAVQDGSMAGVRIASGSANGLDFSFAGTLNQTANAPVVEISDHLMGTLTFSGMVTATNGTGIQLSNVDSTCEFTGGASINGASRGIEINNGTEGTLTFDSGFSITDTTGSAFFVDGSVQAVIASITYSGDIDMTGATAQYAVDVSNLAGGTVTFPMGSVVTVDGAAMAVQMDTSAGGTVSLHTVNVGQTTAITSASAVDAANNTGGTLTLTTANITTNGGAAFIANTGNTDMFTLSTGATSTLDVTGAQPLDLANVTLAMNFASIDVSGAGATNGLAFDDCDGTFTVTGNTTFDSVAATADGLDIGSGTVVFDFSGGTFSMNNTHGNGILVDSITGGSVTLGSVTLGTTSAMTSPVTINNIPMMTSVTLGSVSLGGSAQDAIVVTSNAGTVNIGDISLLMTGSVGGHFFHAQSNSGNVTVASASNNAGTTTGDGIRLDGNSGDVNFTNGVNLAGVSAASIRGLNMNSGTINFGSLGNASSITNNTGTTLFDWSGGSATVTYQGSMTQNQAQTLLNLADITSGSLSFENGTITSTTGNGIRINNTTCNIDVAAASISNATDTAVLIDGGGGNGSITFSQLLINGASTGMDNHGIAIVNRNSGMYNFGSTSSIQNVAGNAIHVDGGVPTVNYDGDITYATDAVAMVDISNLTMAASVTFGALSSLTATDGNGIRLTSNADTSSVAFNGAVDLGTSGTRLSDAAALVLATNGAMTSFTFADLDVFTTGVAGIEKTDACTLNIDASDANDAVSLDVMNGVGLNISGGALNANFADVTVNTNGNCISVTSASTIAVDRVSLTTSNGTGLILSNAGSFTINANMSNAITTTNGPAMDIDNTTIDLNVATLSSTNSTAEGIQLTNLLANSSLAVSGMTTINGTTNEGIEINTVAAGSSLSWAGVDIDNRGATGLFIDNAQGTVSFTGTVDIPNQGNAGGYGVRVEDSSANVDFAVLTISDTNETVAETDPGADGFPDNEGDGDGIFLINNTGTFTVSSGSATNTDGEGVDARSCSGALDFTDFDIDTPGANGFRGVELSGMGHRFDGTALITGVNVSQTSAIRLLNDTATLGGFTFDNITVNNSISLQSLLLFETFGAGDMTIAVTNSTFENLAGAALQVASGQDTGATSTIDATITGNTFQNAAGATGNNSLFMGVAQSGATLDFDVSDNTFSNIKVSTTPLGNESVVRFQSNGGALNGMIDGNTIHNTNGRRNGLGIVSEPPVGQTGSVDIIINDNDIDDIDAFQFEGIFISLRDRTADSELEITNNRIGQKTGSEGDVDRGIFLQTRDSSIPSFTLAVLMDNNTISCDSAATDDVLGVDCEDGTTIAMTMTRNNFNHTNASAQCMDLEAENADSTICLDMNGAGTMGMENVANREVEVERDNGGTFRIEGLGADSAAAAVAAFLNANNTFTGALTALDDGGLFLDEANCLAPSSKRRIR